MNPYIVLIGDIEASKDLEKEKRYQVQNKLKEVFEELNSSCSTIESPYTVTLGDEFQAVFSRADRLFIHVWKVLAALHPVKVRFSIGVGQITTSINREQSLGMDGPAFHLAREGVEQLKESGYLFNISVQGEKSSYLSAMNNSLYLFSDQVRSWNKNRLSILYMMETGMNYKQITEELGISEPAFYKNKEAASLEVVIDLFKDISEIINDWVIHELRDISYAAESDSDFKA
ncbi:MAG TPA: SatD family protein [Halalkalibaculum sp.]|nr:SatD family protein [Halalkalibaculum sp.]